MEIINKLKDFVNADNFTQGVIRGTARDTLTEWIEKNSAEIYKTIQGNEGTKKLAEFAAAIPQALRIGVLTIIAEGLEHRGNRVTADAVRVLTSTQREVLEGGRQGEIRQKLDELQSEMRDIKQKAGKKKGYFAISLKDKKTLHRNQCPCGNCPNPWYAVSARDGKRLLENSAVTLCRAYFGTQQQIVIQESEESDQETSTSTATTSAESTFASGITEAQARARAVLGFVHDLHTEDILTIQERFRRSAERAKAGALHHPEVMKTLPNISAQEEEAFRSLTLDLIDARRRGENPNEEQLRTAQEMQMRFRAFLETASDVGHKHTTLQRDGAAWLRDVVDDSFTDDEREFLDRVRERVLNRDFWEGGARTVWDWFRWAFWTVSGRWLLAIYLFSGSIHVLSVLAMLAGTGGVWANSLHLSWWESVPFQVLNAVIFVTAMSFFIPRLIVPIYDRLIGGVLGVFRGAKNISLPDTMVGRWAMKELKLMQDRDVINKDVTIKVDGSSNDNDRVGRLTHAAIIFDLIGCVSVVFMQVLMMLTVTGLNPANVIILLFALIAIAAEMNRLGSHHFNKEDKKARADRLLRIIEFAAVTPLILFLGSAGVYFISQFMGFTSPVWKMATLFLVLGLTGGLAVILIPPSRAKDTSDMRSWTEKLGISGKHIFATVAAAILLFGALSLADEHYYGDGINWSNPLSFETSKQTTASGKSGKQTKLCSWMSDDAPKLEGCE